MTDIEDIRLPELLKVKPSESNLKQLKFLYTVEDLKWDKFTNYNYYNYHHIYYHYNRLLYNCHYNNP